MKVPLLLGLVLAAWGEVESDHSLEPGPLLEPPEDGGDRLQVLAELHLDPLAGDQQRWRRHVGLGARMTAGPGGRVWVPPQWAQGRLGLLARAAGLRAARDLQ